MLLVDFNELCGILSNCQLSLAQDKLIWRWNNYGKFSTHFAYKWLMFRGIVSDTGLIWWHLQMPLKIKVFMWPVSKHEILTKDNLVKKGWTRFTHCCFCSVDESVDYLFLDYSFAQQILF